jgi:hypothetical protein
VLRNVILMFLGSSVVCLLFTNLIHFDLIAAGVARIVAATAEMTRERARYA